MDDDPGNAPLSSHRDPSTTRKTVNASSPQRPYLVRPNGDSRTTPTTTVATTEQEEEEEAEEQVANARTRAWVQRVLVELGICPFTKHADYSGQGLKKEGVRVGRIAYHAFVEKLEPFPPSRDDASSLSSSSSSSSARVVSPYMYICPLMARTWKAMYEMLLLGGDEDGSSVKKLKDVKNGRISSILLAAPVLDDEMDFFTGPWFALLEASVVAAQAEAWLGVVCFHPHYAVGDGSSWPGFGHMHSLPKLQQWWKTTTSTLATTTTSAILEPDEERMTVAAGGAWQRRTPHATINVLRANELALAEQVRSSDSLYPRNIQVLQQEMGWESLLLWQQGIIESPPRPAPPKEPQTTTEAATGTAQDNCKEGSSSGPSQ